MEVGGELRIRLFGPLDARLNGRALPELNEHRKAAQLLALLALYPNKRVSSEWLATQLWPGIGNIANLKQSVATLRRALSPYGDRLVAQSGSLCLDFAGFDVDVIAFDAAWERR